MGTVQWATGRRLWLAGGLVCAILGLVFACASSAPLTPAPVNGVMLPPHPRLIADAAAWQDLASRRATEPELEAFIRQLVDRARADLEKPVLTRTLEGRRLLNVSREFVRRAVLWAFAWRTTDEAVFLQRAVREMRAVASFSSWNPDHYLDVAEMTAGLAISYDWLYDALSQADRDLFRRAIIDKGIGQARGGHKTFSLSTNWGQVCIGGMVLGALAVGEFDPWLASSILGPAKFDAFTALGAYKPDGVYPEGPGYWGYGTMYETLLVGALESVFKTDWGILASPGLMRSAEIYAQMIGPTGRYFNFSDCGESQSLSPALFFLADKLSQPSLLAAKLAMIKARQGLSERFAPLIALWWPKASASDARPPLFSSGQGPQPIAVWRSSWTDNAALYVAVKGGGGNHNHAHLDAGSFVFDLDGVRWARDLGMQDYNSLESKGVDLWNMGQNSPRWRVFRLGSDGHNTITIDGTLHRASGMAGLAVQPDGSVLIDLTPVFLPGQVAKAARLFSVRDSALIISDTIQGAKPGSSVRWAMNTEAEISLSGNTARLTRSGKTLVLGFEGTDISLSVLELAVPPSPLDAPNPGNRQLHASGPASQDGSWHLTVRMGRD